MIKLTFTPTSDMSGNALDWAVAKCEGWKYGDRKKIKEFQMQQLSSAKHCYSRVWAKGGPILEREGINVGVIDDSAPVIWAAQLSDPLGKLKNVHSQTGLTPLEAAMRCYVSSRLGEEVWVPIELLGI